VSYRSSKTYDHNLGLSCAFRQWRATHSHCSLLHGYALAFTFVFEADRLDDRNWVVDFGGLAELKNSLKYWFDHTTVIAADDPAREHFVGLEKAGLIRMRQLEKVGCEAFAKHAFQIANNVVNTKFPHVRVLSCEVKEHGANSAVYIPKAAGNEFGVL
jgi:6-pyruvoyltetrahydropterin/6-carboxytetrahydropterin synthase